MDYETVFSFSLNRPSFNTLNWSASCFFISLKPKPKFVKKFTLIIKKWPWAITVQTVFQTQMAWMYPFLTSEFTKLQLLFHALLNWNSTFCSCSQPMLKIWNYHSYPIAKFQSQIHWKCAQLLRVIKDQTFVVSFYLDIKRISSVIQNETETPSKADFKLFNSPLHNELSEYKNHKHGL